MMLLKQEPVKAFKYQDHEAHISVHMAAMQDPKMREMVGQSPFAQAIGQAMAAHITEHVAFQYRREIEKMLGSAAKTNTTTAARPSCTDAADGNADKAERA